ncbi:MAG TPA: AI-2E family transporter [Puia sp.]|jgi:predicted PurR-regulated permease PerM|nr:AI-2E family transporter [Puia sp.]
MQTQLLSRTVQVLLLLVLSGTILYLAKPVLEPLAIAAILALVFMPFCNWLEKKGMRTTGAALVCGFLLALIMAGIGTLLAWHIKNIGNDLSEIRANFSRLTDGWGHLLHDSLGIGPKKTKNLITSPDAISVGDVSRTASLAIEMFIGLLVNLLLILVYMIMLLCLRPRIKEFILRLAPIDQQSRTHAILARCVRVVQQYLTGMSFVIGCLWILYSIGFSAIGVKNAIFFAILCGVLEIIPFVGNLTGSALTSLMALTQGGGTTMVLEVLLTYAFIQFLQFYIISPLVMQTQLSIHPLFTILILITGELIWGIPGMILAIPILGIAKIIFDNIEKLQPLGALIGGEKIYRRTAWHRKLRRHSDLPNT